jgi:hypothetical protein
MIVGTPRPDGSRGLSITADPGATVPALGWTDAGLFLAATVLAFVVHQVLQIPA